jgi:hypothetical protein
MSPDRYTALLDLPPERIGRVLALYHWLFTEGRLLTDPNRVAAEVGERLNALGVRANRISTLVQVLHSERSHVARVWRLGADATEFLVPHGDTSAATYARSPYKAAHDRGEWLELKIQETPDDLFGVIPDQWHAQCLCLRDNPRRGLFRSLQDRDPLRYARARSHDGNSGAAAHSGRGDPDLSG